MEPFGFLVREREMRLLFILFGEVNGLAWFKGGFERLDSFVLFVYWIDNKII